MKHIFYKPKESVYQTIVIYPIKDDSHPKDITIFNNIIASHTWVLTLDEFTNSFNDASQLDYLEAEYKEKVVKAYLANKQEFPNEKYKFKTDDFKALADGACYFTACLAGTENPEFLLDMVRWAKDSPLYRDKELVIIDPLTNRYHIPEIVLDELIFNDYPANIKMNFSSHPSLTEKHLIYLSKIPSNTIAFSLLHYHNPSSIEIFENFVKYQPDLVVDSLLLRKDIPQYLKEYVVQSKHTEKDEFKKLLEDDASRFGLEKYRSQLLKALLSNQTNQLLMKINNLNLDTYYFHKLKDTLFGNK